MNPRRLWMMRAATVAAALSLSVLVGCKDEPPVEEATAGSGQATTAAKPGDDERPAPPVESTPAEQDEPAGEDTADKTQGDREEPAPTPMALGAPNNPPAFELPIYQRVGVGQRVGFGLEVIDAETDDIRVELVEKPASATYDPYTLTVDWTPTEADMPSSDFAVRVTETVRGTGKRRTYEHRFAIDVTAEPQPKPTARTLSPAVEQLLTIHDEARLATANAQWPLTRMLTRATELTLQYMPEDQRAGLEVPSTEQLYEDFLVAHARAHDNKTLDPKDASFDAAKFGDPAVWKIIAVRARLDKKWQEVRVIYKSDTPEAAYAMFRFRPVDDRAGEPEQREFNNKAFSQIVVDNFFTPDGKLNPAHRRDHAAHGAAVAKFLDEVINYSSDEHAWSRGGFLALPSGARLGGGSRRDAEGNYDSGDAWAWHVIRPVVADGKVKLDNVGFKGFLADIKPDATGKAYALDCPDKSDPHDARLSSRCRPSGHTDLPAIGDGYASSDGAADDAEIVSAKLDARWMALDYKKSTMVKTVALRDPRRDLFEEKGMSCYQCHVRSFGVRDMYDATAWDPSSGEPATMNKDQATTFFVIVPTTHWQPYAIDFQHKQECKADAAIQEFLGLDTDLGCPLAAE